MVFHRWRNPNCAAMGFDFGLKMEGCFSGSAIEFESLEQTRGTTCENPLVGTFDLTCSDADDGEWRMASITSKLVGMMEVAVMMKGGPGGTIYSGLQNGQTYSLDVGPQRKAISHMEFCFLCSDIEALEEQPGPVTPMPVVQPIAMPTERPATMNPTPVPTPRPTPHPTPYATEAPMALPTTLEPASTAMDTPAPTKCFHCGMAQPPPTDNPTTAPNIETLETTPAPTPDIIVISSTVRPKPPSPEGEIVVISAPVTRDKSAAAHIKPLSVLVVLSGVFFPFAV